MAKISWLTLFFTRVLRIKRSVNLFPELSEDFLGQTGDVRILDVPRAVQRDLKLALDTSRPETHQEHTVTQAHGFADVMSHEYNGRRSVLPDALQLVMKKIA